MAMFKAFKPEAMNKIANAMGYSGNMDSFQQYIEQDPARKARMNGFVQAAQQMAKGGVVRKMQTGGMIPGMEASVPPMYGPEGTYSLTGRPAPPDYSNTPMMNDGNTGMGVPLALTGGQPGGATPVMNDPRGGLGTGDPSRFGPSQMTSQFGNNLDRTDYSGRGFLGNQIGAVGPGGPAQKSHPYTFGGEFTGGGVRDLREILYIQPDTSTTDPRLGGTPVDNRKPLPDGSMPPLPTYSQGVGQAALARGPSTAQPAPTPAASQTSPTTIGDTTTQRVFNPALPQGGVTQAAMTPTGPALEVQQGTGALTGAVAVPTAMAGTSITTPQQESQANVMEAATAAPAVDAAMNATQAAQATVDPRAQVTAAQQTATSVGNLSAAQGNATLIDNPVQRQIQSGELISGAADAQTAATFTEQVQAATATPSTQATVQGQLASLTANFDAANPPAWAAGAMRNATAAMAARGLGASSLAGQAIVQATLEAALPIAQADAQVVAQFEAQNLSNRQQRAMLAAQQRATFMGQEFDQAFQSRVQNSARIGDIANMNFTAEQQVQLENSRAVNTMNLNNLSNSQAMVMAEAAALAQMDASNLNNRQQSAVQNAQAFLQTDMANLSNQQQTDLFKAQSRIQSLFTDQAAANAAQQFNASSQNQVDQFFANLGQQASQFNATQQNAQSQFNAGQANTVNRFNAEMNNQRDQFNAQNQLVIAQSNAQWRRQIATADTAAVNRANELNAAAILDVSKTAYDNLWNYYSDVMEWAWTTGENDKDRITQMALGELSAKTSADMAKLQLDAAESGAIGGFFSDILTSQAGSIAGKFFGL